MPCILVISRLFRPSPEAHALQVSNVVDALRLEGMRVYVVAGLADTEQLACDLGHADPDTTYIPYKNRWNGCTLPQRAWNRLCDEISSVNPMSSWVSAAVGACEKTLRDSRASIVVTTSTPFESHCVGLRLAQQMRIKWIASFSDPWPSKLLPFPYNTRQAWPFPLAQVWLLRQVLRRCDAVHMPSPYGVELVEQASKVPIAHKSWTIPHIGCAAPCGGSSLASGCLVHVGQLTPHRVSRPLLEAVRNASLSYPDRLTGLTCVGRVCKQFTHLVSEMRLDGLVKIVGSLPQMEAMSIAKGSLAPVVIEADMPMSPFLPSKFADYAAIGKPILAVTPRTSGIRDYLTQYGGGYAVGHDVGEIGEAIRRLIEQNSAPSSGVLPASDRLRELFSSHRVGRQYADLVCSIL